MSIVSSDIVETPTMFILLQFEATEIVSMISSEESLDEAVVSIGSEIIDAIPASDPRWAQHANSG